MTKIEEFLKADAIKTYCEDSAFEKERAVHATLDGLSNEIRTLLLALDKARWALVYMITEQEREGFSDECADIKQAHEALTAIDPYLPEIELVKQQGDK